MSLPRRTFILICMIGVSGCSEQTVTIQQSDWAAGATWYQIFPERFRNGSTTNDPLPERVLWENHAPWQVSPWTSDWYKLQDWEKDRSSNFYDIVFDRRYGGDLIGVVDKLDYLTKLGVQVIYFNPIFEAPSLHKYDASTYHHVDNNFGLDRDGDWAAISNETEAPESWSWTSADSVFLDLIKKAHARDIHVVIDGVFNHCGVRFWAFKDVAKKQAKSRYKDWFEVKAWDDPATADTNEFDYAGWWDYKGLPVFREDDKGLIPPVKAYIFDITRRWMDPNADGDPSDGIDGWRLDVAEDVNPMFWEEWYALVKSLNPHAVTIGEIWKKAPEWITEKRFDALMNYPVARAMKDFFVDKRKRISVSEFDQRLREIRNAYPDEANHLMLTLIDSHDTDRIGSMILNPDLDYDRDVGLRHNATYDPSKPDSAALQIQKLVALFQFTYLGAPMIYYGDEAGMWGADDPDDRKPMLWKDLRYEDETYESVRPKAVKHDTNRFNADLFDFYAKLAAIRKASPALRLGDFTKLATDKAPGVYAFSRRYHDASVAVILNNSDAVQTFVLEPGWTHRREVENLLDGHHLRAGVDGWVVTVLPKSGLILN